jgi:hypothetical protein
MRLKAAGVHLLLSALVAALAAVLVFAVWYPFPYAELSGGRDLFMLVVSVDVVVGPLITFAVFNLGKPRRELKRDLAVVALLQVAALVYGLWTVQLARPVHLVFEYDLFRVVHQVDIAPESQASIPAGLDVAPWSGPTAVALRPFSNPEEKVRYTMEALGGNPLAARPELWRPYAVESKAVLAAARPLPTLYKRFPDRKDQIDQAVRKAGREPQRVVFLPLLGRKAEGWTVLLDAGTADILAFLPLDSF